LNFPGTYKIETYSIDYEFAKDSRWTVHTESGDSLIKVDLYHSPGWNNIGNFQLSDSSSVSTTDYFESDSGQYVIADAIRLTSQMDLFNISGSLEFEDNIRKSETELFLYKAGTNTLLHDVTLSPYNNSFQFQNLPSGYYRLEGSRWGYDTLTVDSIKIDNSDKQITPQIMEKSSDAIYSIDGEVFYSDENDSARCRIELIPEGTEIIAGIDSAGHQENYQFSNLPPGNYSLVFDNNGYTDDSETYKNITISDSDLSLDPLTFEIQFNIGWITDSHLGLSSTNSGTKETIDSINANKSMLDFVIHTGDLTEKGLNSELSTANRYLNGIDLPVYIIPGNHDSKWTESGMESYKNNFGDLYYSFDHKGFHFIGLNNAIYLRGGGGFFDPVQLEWLIEDLASMEDPNTPVIVFYHLPSVQSSVSNSWKVLDILKDYRIALILVGHGHSNRTYDFEGLPGVMSMDTYSSGGSGFNVLSASKKELVINPFFTDSGLEDAWFSIPCADTAQPDLKFTNLNHGDLITEEKTINIQLEQSATSGNYYFHENGSASMTGSGKNWEITINPNNLTNGYHALTVNFQLESGVNIKRTCSFYSEDGNYPKASWRYHTGAEVITRPAYDSSQVYIGTSTGGIHAINIEDGTQAWSPVKTGGSVFSSPAVDDSIVYIGSADGNLYAISSNNGDIKWKYEAGSAIINPIAVRDSLIYFAASNEMYAVNKFTREKSWSYSADQLIECQPAIVDNKIIFGSWDTYVHCLNRSTGNRIWKWNRQARFYYSPAACWPVANEDFVFVVDPERYLIALNINNGELVWDNDSYDVWESIGINSNKDQVYARSLNGNLYAFDATAESSTKLWQSSTNYGWDSTPSMPVGKGGLVLSGGKKGFVVSVGQSDGSIKWKYWASHSYITTVNPINEDKVLAAGLDGSVTLIEGDPTLEVKQNKQANLPTSNQLYSPYPNPFNQTVNIEYSLQKGQNLKLTIYDLKGRRVFQKDLSHAKGGRYKFLWNGLNKSGSNLPTGLYFIKIKGNNFQKSRKVLLLK
ncbi:MAG: PQQ-binding-like beta-propeller repeat protein, partial [Candidatus Marinimicrobia bacterium]|nr:PQQ-binding-like beta-propeller repeat protein [Candidatus Neomarinimicrobiota bacterium]